MHRDGGESHPVETASGRGLLRTDRRAFRQRGRLDGCPLAGRATPAEDPRLFQRGALVNARLDLIRQFMKSPVQINPMVSASLNARDSSLTHLLCEFVHDRAWYGSHFFQDYLRPLGLNDQVTSVDLSAPHAVSTICWLSYPRRRCTVRAARLLNFLHSELTSLKCEDKLAPLGGFSLKDLSPRQREVL